MTIAPAPPSLGPGTRLGPFEILRLIKEGGQATVYLARVARPDAPAYERVLRDLAWHEATPEWIAAHGLCVVKLANPGKRDSLIDEHAYLLQVRAALQPDEPPPHLLTLFTSRELKTSDRQRGLEGIWSSPFQDASGKPLPYIALPYVPGGTLDALLAARGYQPLPPGAAVRIALQLCEALAFLHGRVDLIHHDISPSNIALTRRPAPLRPTPPDVVLLDLAAADSPRHPRLRKIFGKTTYLPPQRLTTKIGIVPAIDTFGLGVVLYELLVGQLPQPTSDVLTGLPHPLPPLRQQRPELSPALAELVMDAVSHDQQRWPTLERLRQRLAATPEALQPQGLRGPLERPALLRVIAAAAAVILLVVSLGLGLIAAGGAPTAPTPALATVTPLPTATLAPTAIKLLTATPAP